LRFCKPIELARMLQLFDGEFSDFMAKIGCSNLDEMYERLSAEDKADDRV
jgi:hypothetical protein